MDETSFHRFKQLIVARTGLLLRPRECATLRDTLALRMATLHLRHADEYYQLLQADAPDAQSEWERLIARLTNNESYFFRDKGQMALLRERILPELIARNQAQRSLRLWSAGCSTGEEPYSLAMLADELLPQRGAASGSNWEIVILGTDIDEQALQHARRGIYGSWSFRAAEPTLQQRYFHRQEGGWQVTEAARSVVSFARCNLVTDAFPSTTIGIHDMDLILCRNVFIYFAREAVSAVLPKFAQTLRAGGYLMTGHAETQGQLVESLQARMFPESAVYQRVNRESIGLGTSPGVASRPVGAVAGCAVTRSQSPPPVTRRHTLPAAQQAATASVTPQAATPPAATAERALAADRANYAANDYNAYQAVSRTPPEPAEDRSLLLQAQAQANLGHYEEATGYCRRLISEFPFASAPYELLASIAQEQGRYDEAKLLLKKALYLAPASPTAYLELGALYRSEGDRTRARKMRVTALELLQQMPPEAVVGFFGGPTAQEWILHLQQLPAEGE